MLPAPFYPSYFNPGQNNEHKRGGGGGQQQDPGWLGEGGGYHHNHQQRPPRPPPPPPPPVDYKQPPPFLHRNGPRSPVFHFPPPGCGLLPPPLPSPSHPTSPSGHPYLPPSSSPTFGYYSSSTNYRQQQQQQQQTGRPRTLIEVPRHDPGPTPTTTSSTSNPLTGARSDLTTPAAAQSQPIKTGRRAESTLDPNSRPFTPSGRYVASSSYPNSESETYSQSSSSYADNHHQPTEAECYNTPAYTPPPEDFPPLSEPMGPLLGWETEPDPLPQDPAWLLPNLDMSLDDDDDNEVEDINNNQLEKANNSSTRTQQRLEDTAEESLLLQVGGMPPPSLLLGLSPHWRHQPPPPRTSGAGGGGVGPPLHPTQALPSLLLPTPPQQAANAARTKDISFGGELNSSWRNDTGGRALASAVEKSVSNVTSLSLSPEQRVQEITDQLNRQYESQTAAAAGPGADETKTTAAATVTADSAPPSQQDDQKCWAMSCQPPAILTSGSILSQDYPVPDEYLMSRLIGDRVRPINIRQEHTDLLFFLFYCCQGDALQLVAASLLFERGWRYHKQDRLWLARWPGVRPEEKTLLYEKGLYQYFHLPTWRRMPGWFRLDYSMLCEKTLVPEDLKTMYTRYYSVMKGVEAACNKNPLGLAKMREEFQNIEGIKFLGCIL